MGIAPGHSLQWSDEIQSSHGKGPCDGDSLQSMSREVRLTGVELATFTCSHDFCGIGDHGWPVETLSERVAHEGAWCCVMATNSGVDVSKKLLALGDRDATLQNARGTALV